jgi:hypothetical protein
MVTDTISEVVTIINISLYKQLITVIYNMTKQMLLSVSGQCDETFCPRQSGLLLLLLACHAAIR